MDSIQHYLPEFRRYFDTLCIPLHSDKACVIIEPRAHSCLELVVKNVMYFVGSEWSLYIFHSKQNEEFVKNMLGPTQMPHVHLIRLTQTNFTLRDYNLLLTSEFWWNWIEAEHVLIFQTDSYMRRPGIQEFIDKKYAFIGAPWDTSFAGRWCPDILRQGGNGGFSLRLKSKMLQVIRQFPYQTNGLYETSHNEDIYYNRCLHSLGASLPSIEHSKQFSVESLYYENPVGVHKWWCSVADKNHTLSVLSLRNPLTNEFEMEGTNMDEKQTTLLASVSIPTTYKSFLIYDASCTWEHDYIQDFVTDREGHSLVTTVYVTNLDTLIPLPEMVHHSILVFSSNKYSLQVILKLVKILKPRVIIHLSDSGGLRPEFVILSQYTRLLLRHYYFNHYRLNNRLSNVIHIPLGYMSSMFPSRQPLYRLAFKSASERTFTYCSVGIPKVAMEEALNAFKNVFVDTTRYPFQLIEHASIEDASIHYQNSIFVLFSKQEGVLTHILESFALYESMFCGAIPVVLASKQELETYCGSQGSQEIQGKEGMLISIPPIVYASSWTEAASTCQTFLSTHSYCERQKEVHTWLKTTLERIQSQIVSSLNE
ncbi:MAG: hypothetical protein Sylvanvirus8_20 [Sylvanvirus sp.]|uniref:DUF5672 domain-containing protein n=1 Tax=Sylvanvirus sp. TaxID=2487774 RepID=A0A3G5AJE1_9VIRU|nr:MAG: hypothetical protein Sylvanvirus8_20 [Sylvanvirus sp.]